MRIAGRVVSISMLSVFLLLPLDNSYGGFERRYAGARSLGVAGTLGSFGDGPWTFYSNPARTARTTEVGLFYVPSVLGLQEVRSAGISYCDNILGVDCTGAVQTFGFQVYRETVLSAGMSVPFYDFLFFGAGVNLNHLFIEEYGTEIAASIDAGTRMFLSDNFCAGVSATNLNSASMTNSNDRLPQTISAGIAYVSEELNLGVEYYKELGFPSSVRVAAEYSPARFVTVRTGTASGTNSFNAGFSLRFASFGIEYGAMFHQTLGLTQSFGVSIKFKESDETEFESIRRYRESLRR